MKLKRNALVIIVMLLILSLIQPIVKATDEITLLKKTEEKFLIYIQESFNSEFKFAYSKDKEIQEINLNYIKATKDSNGNYVAYIDEQLKSKFFNDTSSGYIFVKTEKDVKCYEINLEDYITDEVLENSNTITKRIKVKTDGSVVSKQNVNNIEITKTAGKIEITDSENNKYYYQLVKLPSTEQANKFIDVAEQISKLKEDTDIYTKLLLQKEFNKLYENLVPKVNDKNWIGVENMQITQPEDSKQGEQYIVWIKMVNGKDNVIDAQFLTCYEDYNPEVIKEEVVVKTTSTLPVTYDNILVFISILAIVLILIVAVIIMKNKDSKKGNAKE